MCSMDLVLWKGSWMLHYDEVLKMAQSDLWVVRRRALHWSFQPYFFTWLRGHKAAKQYRTPFCINFHWIKGDPSKVIRLISALIFSGLKGTPGKEALQALLTGMDTKHKNKKNKDLQQFFSWFVVLSVENMKVVKAPSWALLFCVWQSCC